MVCSLSFSLHSCDIFVKIFTMTESLFGSRNFETWMSHKAPFPHFFFHFLIDIRLVCLTEFHCPYVTIVILFSFFCYSDSFNFDLSKLFQHVKRNDNGRLVLFTGYSMFLVDVQTISLKKCFLLSKVMADRRSFVTVTWSK